jgi:hypothetical protein
MSSMAMAIIGMLIIPLGLLLIGSLPAYFVEMHKLIFTLLLLLSSSMIIVLAAKD